MKTMSSLTNIVDGLTDFPREYLQYYLAVVMLILLGAAWFVLRGIGMDISNDFIFLYVLVIVLIGVNIFNVIIQIEMLERLDGDEE